MSQAADIVIAFTPGEPAGIGPDLALYLAEQTDSLAGQYGNIALVCIADPEVLTQRALQLGRDFHPRSWNRHKPAAGFFIEPVGAINPVHAGKLDAKNSPYVLATLDRAIAGCRGNEFSALVTGPVHKGIINEANISFTGHTEYLADHCGVETVVMMLVCDRMRVALATTHMPLKEVSRHISQEYLERILSVLHNDLKTHFGISQPVISLCGLNPHAGESGHLGLEEIESVIPAMEKLQQQGMQLIGPLPADTAFTPGMLDGVDAVLAMYHDQGLPVIKHACFGHAVNITLGLPFIRTSVDHGTALDLAGSGQIDCGSIMAAVDHAVTLASQ